MNIKKCSTINACFILIYSANTICAEQTFYCYPATGGSYETRVNIDILEQAPHWDLNTENPPLSARKALRIAEDFLKKAQPVQKDGKYVLDGLSLMSYEDHWFWLARYDWQFAKGGSSGPGFWFQVGILMDGTIVTRKSVESEE